LNRPSLLHIEADRAHGATTAIRVGGRAVEVSRGTMHVPD
jgi:predicted PhzF superfamily epimerase YddE/YHI9